MSEQRSANVSLTQLQTAVREYELSAADPNLDVDCYVTADLRAEAWRLAYEWRDKFGAIQRLNDEQLAELNAGIRLIRAMSYIDRHALTKPAADPRPLSNDAFRTAIEAPVETPASPGWYCPACKQLNSSWAKTCGRCQTLASESESER